MNFSRNLTFINNSCLNAHQVPEPLKKTYISSVQRNKNRYKANCNNYRGFFL